MARVIVSILDSNRLVLVGLTCSQPCLELSNGLFDLTIAIGQLNRCTVLHPAMLARHGSKLAAPSKSVKPEAVIPGFHGRNATTALAWIEFRR